MPLILLKCLNHQKFSLLYKIAYFITLNIQIKVGNSPRTTI